MAVYMIVPKRARRTIRILLSSLTLAETCYDAYAKMGMSISLNLKDLTITIYP